MANKTAIWHEPPTLDEMAASRKNTMVDHLGIELTELGPDFLVGRMPVDRRTIQPYGILHGGASCALAETIGSLAANYCVDQSKKVCVGMEINTSHIKSVRSGFITGVAKPLHIGSTTHVWEILITDDQGNLISVNRLRMAVLDKKS